MNLAEMTKFKTFVSVAETDGARGQSSLEQGAGGLKKLVDLCRREIEVGGGNANPKKVVSWKARFRIA